MLESEDLHCQYEKNAKQKRAFIAENLFVLVQYIVSTVFDRSIKDLINLASGFNAWTGFGAGPRMNVSRNKAVSRCKRKRMQILT